MRLRALACAVPGADLCPHLGPIRGRVHSYPVATVSTGVTAGCRIYSPISNCAHIIAGCRMHSPISNCAYRHGPTPACAPLFGDPTNLCLTSNCYILGSLPLMAAHLTRPEGRKLLVSYSTRTGHAGHILLDCCNELELNAISHICITL